MNFKTTILALSLFATSCHAVEYAVRPYNQATDEQAITNLIKITVDAYVAEGNDMQNNVTKPQPGIILATDPAVDMMRETVNNPDLYTTFVLKESSSIVGFIVIGYDGALPGESEVMANISHFTVLGNNTRYNEYRYLLLDQAIKEVATANVVTKIRWIIFPEFSMSQEFISVFEQHRFKHVKDFDTVEVYELDLGNNR